MAWHLRPRSAAEVVDASIQLLRGHARGLLLLSVVAVIPSMLVALANALLVGDVFTMSRPGAMPNFSTNAVSMLVGLMLLGTCWFLVAFGTLVGAAASAYVDGEVPEPADAIRRVRPRIGVLLGSGVLTYLLVLVQFLAVGLVLAVALGAVSLAIGLASGGGLAGPRGTAGTIVSIVTALAMFASFAVAIVWLSGRYVALPAVAAMETLSVRASMRRARDLSRGSTWRITGLLAIVGVLYMVVSLGTMFTLAAVLGSQVVATAITSIVNVPLYAFFASLVAVLYYDLRVRHEGLDIELLTEELGAS